MPLTIKAIPDILREAIPDILREAILDILREAIPDILREATPFVIPSRLLTIKANPSILNMLPTVTTPSTTNLNLPALPISVATQFTMNRSASR
jgi:hypothetical protein